MKRNHRRVDSAAGWSPAHASAAWAAEARAHARRTIVNTLTFHVALRDAHLEIIEHSALVAVLCRSLAQQTDLPEVDREVLQMAAELHEVGMFAIAPDVLMRATPTLPEELAVVRGQAKLSATLSNMMHHPRIGCLIEHQYEDFHDTQRTLEPTDLLLSGILRVADTIAAVTRSAADQHRLTLGERAELLTRGAGSRFHPTAVECVLALAAFTEPRLAAVG